MNTSNRMLRQAVSVMALCLAPLAMTACTDHRLVTEATWKQQDAGPAASPARRRPVRQSPSRPRISRSPTSSAKSLAMFVRQSNLQAGSHVSVAAPTKTAAQAARSRNRLASVRNELQRMGISTSIVQAESTDNQHTGDEVVVFARNGRSRRAGLPRLQSADHARL